MPPAPTPRDHQVGVGVGVALSLYVFEAALAAFAVALYKYYGRLGALSLRQAALVGAPALVALLALAYAARGYVRARGTGRRRFWFTLAANLIAVTLMFGTGEVLVRLLSVATPMGPSFAGTLLLPKRWELQKQRNAGLLRDAPANISYFVRDTLLGWSVAPARRSKSGLYLSSTEGIRSPRIGISYAADDRRTTIAAIGDSFTFGLEGPYEDSWESQLEPLLGSDTRILNFGIDGYGMDQAYLRYMRDARPWHPRLTLFGFIDHDLGRAMSVYTFLTYPNWGIPFSKPRFTLIDGALRPINFPVLSPEAILEKHAVADLPFVDRDPGYNPDEWKRHMAQASYLVRYLVSRFPRWTARSQADWATEEVAVNSEILRAFGRQAAIDGTVPFVIYFPTRGDFEGLDRTEKDKILAAVSAAGIHNVDLTSCIGRIGPGRAFIPGHQHYSAAGNGAVAQCLEPLVRHEIQRLSPDHRRD